ncbi:MAG: endonuclease III domain-containing protein [Candidatus Woesearchaeota archaeon]
MDEVIKYRRGEFLKIWRLAHKKYKTSTRRLAGEGWNADWKLLITTMLSAQNRDEVTIPVAEDLFKKYSSLKQLASADVDNLKEDIKKINYNVTKARHIKLTSNILLDNYGGVVPNSLSDLISLPGVGIKTANLVLAELFNVDAICVDTHVHRIANVFGFVKTSSPEQTEKELMVVVPKKYWSKINRVFVLWGQDVKGYDREKFLYSLKN